MDCPDTQLRLQGLQRRSPRQAQNLIGQMLYASANLGNTLRTSTPRRVDYDLSKSQRLTVRSFIDKFVQPAGDTPGNVLSVLNLNTWNQTFGEQMWYFNEIAAAHLDGERQLPSTRPRFCGPSRARTTARRSWTRAARTCAGRATSTSPSPALLHGRRVLRRLRTAAGLSPRTKCAAPMGILRHSDQDDPPPHDFRGHRSAAPVGGRKRTNYPADAIINFGGDYTGNGLSDWLLGYMSSFEQGAGELADIQGWQVDPYVNDEFRVKPGLTLTLGLRWDPDFAPISVGGRGAAFRCRDSRASCSRPRRRA